MKRFSIALIFSVISLAVSAQSGSFYFKNYQVINGLSNNIITSILQDKKGFMWFGTRNGLNRFSGTSFKIFSNNPADSTSIGSNSILSLFEDEHEQLWVGTYKGIYLYNPLSESFKPFNKVPAGEIRYIKSDRDHNIWIIANLTLYKYNPTADKIYSYPLTASKDHTIALHISAKNEVWAATMNGFLKRYLPKSNSFQSFDIAGLNKERKLSSILDLCPVSDSTLMIGTMNQALLFNYKKQKLTNLFPDHNKTDIHVHTIFNQSADEYWLGTEAGLCIYNLKTRNYRYVNKEFSNPYSITDNVISAVYRDKEGGIWVGTYFGGVNYYSRQFNNFQKYFPEPGKNTLSGNIVHEICKDNYGKLWIGTEDAGLNQMDLKTGVIKSFLPDKKPGSISYHNIHGLVADDDKLWIGTYEHGLDVMDLKTNKVIKHYNAALDGRSFRSNFIVTLFRTADKDILVGTWSGLFKYNRATDDFSAIPFFDFPIQSMYEDKDGTLWVSSYGNGVHYCKVKINARGEKEYEPHKVRLFNNYVNSLYKDSKYNFWFCTEGGLIHYNPSNGETTNYTTENGLSVNQVFRVLEDDKGLFWISTSKGLCRFNPTTQDFTIYHTPNGLPTEQFNYNSSFKNTDGTLFFGTVKGLISFKPADFISNTYIPPVYITGLQVNNMEVAINQKDSPLKQSQIYPASITLPYDQSNITIDVAALSFIIPEMNAYKYKLDGVDKNWVDLKNNRKVYFTKLPPGSYTFRVKGSNSEGIWNEKEATLHIKILPPVWATVWAYILYAFIISTIIFIIFRYYYLALSEKSKRRIADLEINKEREIYSAKIDFFTNVTHEIRTPLTLIKMPLDKLIAQRFEDKEINESLEMMNKNTNRLIDLTNQLLDFRKAEANNFSLSFTDNNINNLLSEVFAQFRPVAEQKQLQYKLEMPRIVLHAYTDNEALRKILSNLINNAIKYSSEKVIVKLLAFSSEDLLFHIEVTNDGYIIPAELNEKIFEPFFRIKDTDKEAGTGIGLSLARSLAELHNGKLELKHTSNDTNTFLLSLPIHQDTEFNLRSYEDKQDSINEPVVQKEIDRSKSLILIVEDNVEILNYLSKELSSEYSIVHALNGLEAIDVLQKENVQLVISDIMMPLMDGIELCRHLKSDLQFSHIPIILLTAKNSINSKIEGLEVGADAYIEKPFSLDHLIAQMNNLLMNRTIIKDYFSRTPLSHVKAISFSKADKNFIDQLNQVIYQNITDMDLDVETLSKMMNMSKPTLYRKIKALSDLTPNELINLTRLKKGAELLAEGNYKINEVADMIGYTLSSNFSRDFQKQFGISPSQFISNLKKEV